VYPANADEMRSLLGLQTTKLPAEGMDVRQIDGYRVRVLPLEPPRISRWGRPLRRMKHRIQVECGICGKWISAGRLRQHEIYKHQLQQG
jgi:hypothetical protein